MTLYEFRILNDEDQLKELWDKKAEEYGFNISDVLKDKEDGYDLADYILETIKE